MFIGPIVLTILILVLIASAAKAEESFVLKHKDKP